MIGFWRQDRQKDERPSDSPPDAWSTSLSCGPCRQFWDYVNCEAVNFDTFEHTSFVVLSFVSISQL